MGLTQTLSTADSRVSAEQLANEGPLGLPGHPAVCEVAGGKGTGGQPGAVGLGERTATFALQLRASPWPMVLVPAYKEPN